MQSQWLRDREKQTWLELDCLNMGGDDDMAKNVWNILNRSEQSIVVNVKWSIITSTNPNKKHSVKRPLIRSSCIIDNMKAFNLKYISWYRYILYYTQSSLKQ